MTNLPEIYSEKADTVYISNEVLRLVAPDAKNAQGSRLMSLICMILLYASFLFALAIVYAMNLALVAPATAVGALSALSVAAVMLLVRVLHSK